MCKPVRLGRATEPGSRDPGQDDSIDGCDDLRIIHVISLLGGQSRFCSRKIGYQLFIIGLHVVQIFLGNALSRQSMLCADSAWFQHFVNSPLWH